MSDYNIDFKDHIVENPNRFRQTVVAPGIVDLVPVWVENPSQVIQEGTPVNADLFDKLRANVTRRSETFAATAGQTVFNLTKAFLVDQGRIDVYISGIKQRSGVDFTETSPTSFTLSEGLDAGTIVEAVYFSASQALSEDLIEQVQAAEAATIAANEATANAIDATEGALTANLNWKEPVNNLTALNALSNPQIRDTRQTRDTGDVYRYDGTAWVLIQTMDPNAINALDTRLTSQLAENTQLVTDVSQGSFIVKDDVTKIKTLVENDKPLKIAILGDSTKAGVGWRYGPADTGYGECGDIDRPSSPEMFYLNLIKKSKYFITPNKSLGNQLLFSAKGAATSYVSGTATSLNWDRYVMTYGIGGVPDSLALSFKHLPKKRNKLGVYYLARTADGAARFDVVCNGVTTTVDSYKAPQDFGSVTGIAQQGFTLFAAEITIPTDADTFDVTINNVRQGGSATASAQGTATIVGFYYGTPPRFRNFSIRNTTLTNNSARNQSKGVATDERLQKAYAFGANVFYLGWGSNDAADGVTAETFGSMLRTRIDEIRAQNSGAIIIIDSVWHSIYNSKALFDESKRVALEKGCSFLDGNNILRNYTEVEVINDYVHQNEFGYRVVGEAMNYLFTNDSVAPEETQSANKNLTFTGSEAVAHRVNALGGEANGTTTDSVILTKTLNTQKLLLIKYKLALMGTPANNSARFAINVNGVNQDFARVYNTGQQDTLTCYTVYQATGATQIDIAGQMFTLSGSGSSSHLDIIELS